MMNKILIFVALLMMPISFAQGQDDDNRDSKAKQEIIKVYREYTAAREKRDAAVMNRILADDYGEADVVFGVVDGGSNLKAQTLALYKASPHRADSVDHRTIEIHSTVVTIHGDTAVLTSRETSKGIDPRGHAYNDPILVTHVFVKRDGRWQIIATHGGQIKEIAAQAGNQK
ncbi:MAG: nuclear transport factor 2 family protein [Pyrinomonadaceae bacterium MAG19_C2-C3]|nr:nuclear transport factor 2 family protein [Pyrinomonadaceae bacterium MAG19_C2-C3]